MRFGRSGSDQRWGGLAADGGLDDLGEVSEEGAVLQAAGDRGGEQSLGCERTVLGATALGELAVDDRVS